MLNTTYICGSCGSECNKSGLGCPCSASLTTVTYNNVVGQQTAQQGTKSDDGKIPCELLSPAALLGTAEVLRYGAKKYSINDWRKGLAWSRLIGAVFRHLLAFMAGEDLDKETGLPHLDHAATEIMFLQEFFRTRKDLDDRYVPNNKQGDK